MRNITAIAIVLLSVANGFAQWPPAGSPLQSNDRPRLWFISDSQRAANSRAPGLTRSEMRTRLKTVCSSEFKAFISRTESYYDDVIDTKEKANLTCDGMSFAFLAVLAPSTWTDSGFTFKYTTAQYAAKAKEYWEVIVSKAKNNTQESSVLDGWIDSRYIYTTRQMKGGYMDMSMAVIYDWLGGKAGSWFDENDTASLLAAMKNQNILNTQGYSKTPYLNNVASGCNHNAHYVSLAIYGDVVDSDLTTVFNGTEEKWLKGTKELGNHVWGNGANWNEGLSIYYFESVVHIGTFFGGLSSAMGEDLFTTTGFLNDMPEYMVYMSMPTRVQDGMRMWYSHDDDGPTDNEITVSDQKAWLLVGGMLNRTNPVKAGLLKWWAGDNGFDYRGTGSASGYYIPREEDVFFKFFSGLKDVAEVNPTTQGIPGAFNLGGRYTIKSDHTSDSSTHISFNAQKYNFLTGGHSHFAYGNFSIHKYGNLTHQRSMNKGKGGVKEPMTRANMYYNTIGIYRPGAVNLDGRNLLMFRTGYNEVATQPHDEAYAEEGVNHVGEVVAESLNNSDFDYIDYDFSRGWSDDTCTYSEREFVYLRSRGGVNDEYVVVYDRVEAPESNIKYNTLNVMNKPVLYDGASTVAWSRTGAYPGGETNGIIVHQGLDNSNTVSIVQDFVNGSYVTHGKMFVKALFPVNYKINLCGGPGYEWQDSEGKMVTTADFSDLINKYARGQYSVRIEPADAGNYNKFLNVMQIGSSSKRDGAEVLVSMTDTTRVTASTGSFGNLVGAHIRDHIQNRIVLFNDQKSTDVKKQKAPYEYICHVTAQSFHLLTNIEPGEAYRVSDGTGIIAEASSSKDGVLTFSDTTNSSGSITYTITKNQAALSIYGTTISWPAFEGDVKGYELHYGKDGGDFDKHIVFSGNQTSYAFDLKEIGFSLHDDIYSFKLKVIDSAGEGAFVQENGEDIVVYWQIRQSDRPPVQITH